MDNPAPLSARQSEEVRRRRWPWLTREDLATLEALPPAQARSFEVLLHIQARSDAEFHTNVSLEAEVGAPGCLEYVHGARSARWTHGTGGGRSATYELSEG